MTNRLRVFLGIVVSLAVIGVVVAVATTYGMSSVPNLIYFQGPEADNEGFAGWNVPDSSGIREPSKTGHNLRYSIFDNAGVEWICGLPATTCGGTVAVYYLASRDYDPSNAYLPPGGAIDALSERSLHVDSVSGFSNFVDSLTHYDLPISGLNMTWGRQSLGDDVMDQDWTLTGAAEVYEESEWLETRLYTGGTFTIKLDDQNMVGGPMPRTIVTIKYNDPDDCLDDEISAVTEIAFPSDGSWGSSAAVQAAAAGFLQDLRNDGIKFDFTSVQPAQGQSALSGYGRDGAFFDVQHGRIEARVWEFRRIPFQR